MLAGFRTAYGVARSLLVYYGDRGRAAAMDRLHQSFVRQGDLVFDVGAHVGDRVASFRRLGASVVAVEPQPALLKTLKLIYGRDSRVAIEPVAVGARAGTLELMVNTDNPAVSSASQPFVEAAQGAAGWESQRWPERIHVAVTTLDALIGRHGTPAFIKIDVEGFEAEALAGLTQPVNALSFEFTTIQRDIALACLARCGALGYTRFNAALGETQSLAHREAIDSATMARWLTDLPHAANSGDVYAIRG